MRPSRPAVWSRRGIAKAGPSAEIEGTSLRAGHNSSIELAANVEIWDIVLPVRAQLANNFAAGVYRRERKEAAREGVNRAAF